MHFMYKSLAEEIQSIRVYGIIIMVIRNNGQFACATDSSLNRKGLQTHNEPILSNIHLYPEVQDGDIKS